MKVYGKNSLAGSTLVEAAIASAIVALFLSGVYEMNWRGLSVLKTTIESVSVTRVVQGRMEQIRTGNWNQIIDSTYISGVGGTVTGTVLSTAPCTASNIGSLSEKIEIAPMVNGVASSGSSVMVVTRDSSGNVTVVSAGQFGTATSVQAHVVANWTATTANQVLHSREISGIISKGGITGRN